MPYCSKGATVLKLNIGVYTDLTVRKSETLYREPEKVTAVDYFYSSKSHGFSVPQHRRPNWAPPFRRRPARSRRASATRSASHRCASPASGAQSSRACAPRARRAAARRHSLPRTQTLASGGAGRLARGRVRVRIRVGVGVGVGIRGRGRGRGRESATLQLAHCARVGAL